MDFRRLPKVVCLVIDLRSITRFSGYIRPEEETGFEIGTRENEDGVLSDE